jgi:hypothetical protein
MMEENVSSMSPNDEKYYSETWNMPPLDICSRACSWVRRPRLYWVSWPVQEEPGVIIEKGLNSSPLSRVKVPLSSPRGDMRQWLSLPWEMVDAQATFPTFTRSIPRNRPPPSPAGLKGCSLAALERWEIDDFRFPPYTYEDNFMVTDGTNTRRLNAEEREVIMGFPAGYTAPCLPKSARKSGSVEWEDVRLGMVGNTFQVYVVAWLFSQLLSSLGLSPLPFLELCQVLNGSVPSTRMGVLCQRPLTSDSLRESVSPASSLDLVLKICRGATYKGSDVRLNDVEGSAGLWPRKPLPSKLWHWKTVIAYRFKHLHGPEHINALELRAFLSMLKWRTSQAEQHHSRILHLLDSQVALSALAKGRSSSLKLSVILRQCAALQLCADVVVFGAYVATQDNPADAPSRGFLERSIGKRKWVRVR